MWSDGLKTMGMLEAAAAAVRRAEEYRDEQIERAMRMDGLQITDIARAAGVSRTTLWRRYRAEAEGS